ncbi:DUF4123 domain-containing protein [Neptuniibacter sp. PT34_22]|uniref:DUF4123 domain-containing protein n=1 Tax=Neptuniibacter sp. PT34_22 TaxID=3398205 RepID=UPI0039F5D6C0
MQSEHVLSLRDQIDQLEEKNSEQNNYFCVLSGTSKINGLENFYTLGGSGAKPLWLNTPYADWEEVMPYLVNIDSDSPFIDWLEAQQQVFPDWGLLVASSYGFDEIFTHFESLTKVLTPSGKEVFFRYWDAPQSQPVLALSDEPNRAELMGPVSYWLSSQGGIEHPSEPQVIGKRFPWWMLSEALALALFKQNPAVVKQNLKQRLIDNHYDSIDGMSESLLDARLGAFIKNRPDGNVEELLKYLSRWQR